MTYSIKDVSQKTGLSIYTLRYYDKKGLMPFVGRNQAGYREFTDSDLSFIHTICCLKNTGMKISNIKRYIDYCMKGPTTIEARKQLLSQHRQQVLDKQKLLQENLKEVDYKLKVYSQPNADEIINRERQFVSHEKRRNHLDDPFQLNGTV